MVLTISNGLLLLSFYLNGSIYVVLFLANDVYFQVLESEAPKLVERVQANVKGHQVVVQYLDFYEQQVIQLIPLFLKWHKKAYLDYQIS